MNINAIVPAQRKFILLWKWLPFEEKAKISPRGASLCFMKSKISLRHVAAVQKIQTKQLLSLQAKDRLVHRRLPVLCNNSREITPPSRELCRILDHSSLLIQPPVPLLPLQDLQRQKNLGPFRSERPGLMTFSALGPHKLSLCRHVRKKLCCRMLGSDARKWFFRVKELLSMWKPNWKVFSQNWKPVVGLNCWEVGHPAQNFR